MDDMLKKNNVFSNILMALNLIWKADKKSFLFATIFLLWSIIPTTYNVVIYKLLIDSIELEKSFGYIFVIIALYAVVSLTSRLLSNYMYEHKFNKLSLNVAKYVNSLILKKSIRMDYECFDTPEKYDNFSKALSQSDDRAMTIFYQVNRLIGSIINFFIGITIIGLLDPIMIVVAILSGIIMFILDISFVKVNFQSNEEIAPISRRVSYFKNLFFNRKVASDIKQYSRFSDLLMKNYIENVDKQIGIAVALSIKKMIHSVKTQSIVVLNLIFFPYVYLAYRCYKKVITIGDIPTMFNAFNLIVNGLSECSREITNLKESSLYMGYIRAILEYEPQIECDTSGDEIDSIETIEFSNVSFIYPNSDSFVLKNISFLIQKNQKIAIVGINGAGKTTLVKLIMRYYDATEGIIRINGKDIKEYNINALRNTMATLFQELQTYALPIGDIIACASDYDSKQVDDLLNKVGLYSKIYEEANSLQCEYGKEFDKKGIIFSGGQIQKLFLTRMLYKSASLLIMDEPSSALDPISEYEFHTLMLKIAKSKMLILISHKLSTTKDADVIILFEKGEIVERGSHSDLMSIKGKYHHLFTIQSQQYSMECKKSIE